ncbi:hypothetical protein EJ02DRAFT_461705 [Clathrospora elynae]|uniref:Uncharacterized protein n=1 Tax=Clathrospora elynae TaxID=706981 RepID=A0A6A5T3G3_9PLEO|nr:hypothetical protein EJ02DRAFT_461705 [Clathrospora elynae]
MGNVTAVECTETLYRQADHQSFPQSTIPDQHHPLTQSIFTDTQIPVLVHEAENKHLTTAALQYPAARSLPPTSTHATSEANQPITSSSAISQEFTETHHPAAKQTVSTPVIIITGSSTSRAPTPETTPRQSRPLAVSHRFEHSSSSQTPRPERSSTPYERTRSLSQLHETPTTTTTTVMSSSSSSPANTSTSSSTSGSGQSYQLPYAPFPYPMPANARGSGQQQGGGK